MRQLGEVDKEGEAGNALYCRCSLTQSTEVAVSSNMNYQP